MYTIRFCCLHLCVATSQISVLMHTPREATATALETCDMFAIDQARALVFGLVGCSCVSQAAVVVLQSSLDQVLSEFPAAAEGLHKIAENRLRWFHWTKNSIAVAMQAKPQHAAAADVKSPVPVRPSSRTPPSDAKSVETTPPRPVSKSPLVSSSRAISPARTNVASVAPSPSPMPALDLDGSVALKARSAYLWARLREEVVTKKTFSGLIPGPSSAKWGFMKVVTAAVKQHKGSAVNLEALMSGRFSVGSNGKSVSSGQMFLDTSPPVRRNVGARGAVHSKKPFATNLSTMTPDELRLMASKAPFIVLDGELKLLKTVLPELLARLRSSTRSLLATSAAVQGGTNSPEFARKHPMTQTTTSLPKPTTQLKETRSAPNVLSVVKRHLSHSWKGSPSSRKVVPEDTLLSNSPTHQPTPAPPSPAVALPTTVR